MNIEELALNAERASQSTFLAGIAAINAELNSQSKLFAGLAEIKAEHNTNEVFNKQLDKLPTVASNANSLFGNGGQAKAARSEAEDLLRSFSQPEPNHTPGS